MLSVKNSSSIVDTLGHKMCHDSMIIIWISTNNPKSMRDRAIPGPVASAPGSSGGECPDQVHHFDDAAGTISLVEVAGAVELRVMEPSVLHFVLHGGQLSGRRVSLPSRARASFESDETVTKLRFTHRDGGTVDLFSCEGVWRVCCGGERWQGRS